MRPPLPGVTLPTPPASYGPKWTYQDTLTLSLTEPVKTQPVQVGTTYAYSWGWYAEQPLVPDGHRWMIRRVMTPPILAYSDVQATMRSYLMFESPGVVSPTVADLVSIAASNTATIELSPPAAIVPEDPTITVQVLYAVQLASTTPEGSRCLIQYDDYISN
jgi:hypothetical protein